MGIKALRELLVAEEQELICLTFARSSKPTVAVNHHGTVHASVGYSDKMTWKDKIILAVAEAKRPLLAKEISPVLLQSETHTISYTKEHTFTAHLTRHLRDGVHKRLKR